MNIVGIDDACDNSYLYEGTNISDFSRDNATVFCSNASEVVYSNYHKEATNISVNISVTRYEENAKLLFPLYGYTGYEVRVNGEKVPMERIAGRVACDLPEEDALIEVAYVGLPWFKVADITSLLTVAAAAGYGIYTYYRRRNPGSKKTSADEEQALCS